MRRFTFSVGSGGSRKPPDFHEKLSYFRQMLHQNKTSFSYNNKHYEFNDIGHLQNVIRKMVNDNWNKNNPGK